MALSKGKPATKTKIVPARLFMIVARRSPVAVIFRRGPSHWVQLIKWDTGNDTFQTGQWLHGRIYERRCDLSPDGSLLITAPRRSPEAQRCTVHHFHALASFARVSRCANRLVR